MKKLILIIPIILVAVLYLRPSLGNFPPGNPPAEPQRKIKADVMAPPSIYHNDVALKQYIKQAALRGYLPHFSQEIDRERIARIYIELFEEANGNPKDKNLWEGIREGEKKKGSIVQDIQYE